MKLDYEEFDLSGVRRYPLASRASKVRRDDLAQAYPPGAGLGAWLARLPKLLAARDLLAVVEAIEAARAAARARSCGAWART